MNRCTIVLMLCLLLTSCVTLGGPTGAESKDIEVTQVDRGTMITVSERIMFPSGSSVIKPDSAPLLDQVAKVLVEKTKSPILVEGHTDNIGSKELNLALSEKRANAVKNELAARGVVVSRITTKGLWFSAPKADNTTEVGRAQNRRTEILVLGEKKENLGNNLEAMLQNVWLKVKQIFS